LNYDTAKNIAVACKKINAKMIFVSSSYVFDGEKGNYSECDEPNALNKYAISKIKAEKKVLELENSIVIRLEPIYGYDEIENQLRVGTNYFEGDMVNGYTDLLRSPVYINDIPIIIQGLINSNQSGIFNIAGPTKLRWLDFLKKLSSIINAENKVKIVDNSNWILKPPQDSSLDISKIKTLGFTTTSFDNSISDLKKNIALMSSYQTKRL
jgi:dTDP-4-dehydrorhamnose reductase